MAGENREQSISIQEINQKIKSTTSTSPQPIAHGDHYFALPKS